MKISSSFPLDYKLCVRAIYVVISLYVLLKKHIKIAVLVLTAYQLSKSFNTDYQQVKTKYTKKVGEQYFSKNQFLRILHPHKTKKHLR